MDRIKKAFDWLSLCEPLLGRTDAGGGASSRLKACSILVGRPSVTVKEKTKKKNHISKNNINNEK